ncbi:MAG: hypothetical protein LBR30_01990, partial [Clostridioides sp.]|nr:hypothetical protein [Clostridioides sp.]
NDTTNSDDTNNSVKTDTVTIDNATTLVNYPIDTPLLSGSIEDRPMLSWIFSSEEYTNLYHEVYSEYMEYFSSGKFEEMYDNAINLISEYVKNDPTAFCSYEEFQKGSSELKKFCLLRAESISSQLNGKIASTTEEQSDTNNANFVLASDIDIQSMGTNNMGGGMERGGRIPVGNFGTQNLENQNTTNSNTNNIDIENESSENTSNTNDTNMQNRLNENDSNTNDINMQNRLNENTSNTNDANMQNKLNENTSNTEDVINTNENTENGDYSTEAIGQDRVWSRERNNIQGGFPNMNSSESNTSNNKNTIILLISSIVILIGGIVFVKKKY